jgi:hypothetical protein
VVRGGSPGGYGRKSNAKIVSGTETIKYSTIHVYVKTAFVGWPSTESRWISSLHNFWFLNHYFRK